MKEDLTNPSALHDELQNNAMQLFKFDKDDLPFNRDGKLSNKQVQRFIFETRKFTGVFIFSGLLLAGLFILSWSKDKPLNQLPLGIPISMIAAFTIIAIFGYMIGSKIYKTGIVSCSTGMVSFLTQNGKMLIEIDGEYFASNINFQEVFISNVIYKIYYTPTDRSIVATEIIA